MASPFLPALVNARGLPAAQLGLVLSAGTAVRLLTAPLAGRLGEGLWSESVAAEVLVFFLIGPALVTWLTPAGALAVAALAAYYTGR